ncbi:hypothetical protein KL939_004109 [Ogataea angusta]|nr:hypothetical protein KL943_003575 [Ogataea angusta]KAG7856457.1 hypothetical protein KL939_004109 [Ogataea angusta]
MICFQQRKPSNEMDSTTETSQLTQFQYQSLCHLQPPTHVKAASGAVFGLSCSERCRNQIHKFAAYYREYEIADREAETGGNTRDFVLWSSPA